MPLIVSVMATEPRGLRAAGRGGRRARRGRRDRAQRLLPQRPVRADRRRAAGRDRGAARGAAPADREAADREADAERRRPGRGRGRRRGGRGRRGLADQHAEGERDRPGDRRARARRPATAGSPGPAVRPIALAQVRARRRGGRDPGRSAWAGSQRRRRARVPRRRGDRWSRSGPRTSATRWPARGSRAELAAELGRAGLGSSSRSPSLDLNSRSR